MRGRTASIGTSIDAPIEMADAVVVNTATVVEATWTADSSSAPPPESSASLLEIVTEWLGAVGLRDVEMDLLKLVLVDRLDVVESETME